MAQRWMQSKEQLARKHGRTVSGCDRAMGGVMDDRPIGFVESPIKPKSKHKPAMPPQKADKPKVWGAKRKTQGFSGMFTADSRIKVGK